MLLQAPNRVPIQPLNTAEVVRLQRETTQQRQDFARVFGARPGSPNEQAAVLHFGSRALSLARGALDEASVSESDDVRPPVTGEADESTTTEGADASPAEAAGPSTPAASTPRPFDPNPLSPEDRQRLSQLRVRDREVRTHEQAHKTAGGQHAGSVRLEYQVGPDGARYAVEGSVPIDVSPVTGDPAATLRKMEIVARAANAPASPSGADRSVAAQAARVSRDARAQMAAERYTQAQQLA
jgi:hypothetical protein